MKKFKLVFWRFSSIKQELMFYNILLFTFIVVMTLILSISNFNTISVYNDFSKQYSILSSFYSYVRAADQFARSYLYNRAADDQKQYELYASKANRSIDNLIDIIDNQQLKWRFGRLKNMILTYDEIYVKLKTNGFSSPSDYNIYYDFMINTAKNIDSTSTQYYNLITEKMNQKSDNIIEGWKWQIGTVILLVSAMIIVAVAFLILCINDITQPIERIVKNIQKIKLGQYDLKEVKHAGAEMATLCNAFDDMAKSVQLHIQDVEEKARLENQLLEKENENLRISKLLAETELKALQSQINPHFLFNTLSLISKMAYMESSPQTSEMLETLAELLRYCIDNANKTSDLHGEIECTNNYLTIQRKRFGHRVQFEFMVEDNLPDITLPGLIIQPLIENAVIHGVGQMVKDGRVSIQICRAADKINIIVEDNGKGMDSDLVEQILSERQTLDSDKDKKCKIGLYNVMRRLKMFFGTECNIQIESSIDCGTVIIIKLPIETAG